jgi:hypothetical protein
VLAALLLGFLTQKLAFDPEPIGYGRADGSFYYQVARHVASGDSLRTSVSLYNQGLRELPAPTTIYPLWPLVLGATGRWIGLPRAAWLVPEILFFVELLLLYCIANRIGCALGGAIWLRIRGLPLVDLGHVAVLLFGGNSMFFVHTSVPWTEGLAFALLFGSLLAVHGAARRSSVAWAAAAGTLAGLAYLTRTQMVGLPLAIAAPLLLVGREEFRWRLAGAALAGSAAAILPWILFLASFVTHFPLRMLVDFTAYRETPQLPPYPGFVRYASGADRLLDFAGSFVRAFHPTRPETYLRSFGAVVYLVPVAAGLALWRASGRPARARARCDPDRVLVLAAIRSGASGTARGFPWCSASCWRSRPCGRAGGHCARWWSPHWRALCCCRGRPHPDGCTARGGRRRRSSTCWTGSRITTRILRRRRSAAPGRSRPRRRCGTPARPKPRAVEGDRLASEPEATHGLELARRFGSGRDAIGLYRSGIRTGRGGSSAGSSSP